MIGKLMRKTQKTQKRWEKKAEGKQMQIRLQNRMNRKSGERMTRTTETMSQVWPVGEQLQEALQNVECVT